MAIDRESGLYIPSLDRTQETYELFLIGGIYENVDDSFPCSFAGNFLRDTSGNIEGWIRDRYAMAVIAGILDYDGELSFDKYYSEHFVHTPTRYLLKSSDILVSDMDWAGSYIFNSEVQGKTEKEVTAHTHRLSTSAPLDVIELAYKHPSVTVMEEYRKWSRKLKQDE